MQPWFIFFVLAVPPLSPPFSSNQRWKARVPIIVGTEESCFSYVDPRQSEVLRKLNQTQGLDLVRCWPCGSGSFLVWRDHWGWLLGAWLFRFLTLLLYLLKTALSIPSTLFLHPLRLVLWVSHQLSCPVTELWSQDMREELSCPQVSLSSLACSKDSTKPEASDTRRHKLALSDYLPWNRPWVHFLWLVVWKIGEKNYI